MLQKSKFPPNPWVYISNKIARKVKSSQYNYGGHKNRNFL